MGVWFLLLVVFSAMGVLGLAQTQYQNPAPMIKPNTWLDWKMIVYFLLGIKSDFISIDCGAQNDYDDDLRRLHYKTDDGFIDSGKNMEISAELINKDIWHQGKNLREFPNGTRNCYTLRPNKGKENKYLIRASFYYGNYNRKNQVPVFDLHIGTDYWATVNTPSFTHYEVIHEPKTNDIQVCLINTGNGVPFISILELRLLDSSMYQTDSASLSNHFRSDIGSSNLYRYPQDVYDRIWTAGSFSDFVSFNITATTSLRDSNDSYKVPEVVLRTGQRATDVNSSLALYWRMNTTYKGYMYFHFAEFENLPSGQKREFTISVDGDNEWMETVALEYLKPVTIASALLSGPQKFSINATRQSGQYPPILNAVEFFTIVEHLNTPTAMDDITAINHIKEAYSIKRDSWQGDPCAPKDFIWEGLECSYDNTPRIIALNLSSSKLSGNVTDSFSNLLALASLDLSVNQLTGQVPESLATLTNLKKLNLSGNNLNGSIPQSLWKKVDDQSLQLSVVNNPNLCLENSCKPKRKRNSFVIPAIAAASGSVAILLIVLAIIWRVKRRKGLTEGTIRSRNRPFTYSEVSRITNNFSTVIGEGGFGKVYLGKLANGTNVAVKMLSRTSQQGHREFQAEAQLLMIVHHKNLVSLVGYCDDADNMALIYEFMENGNLRQHLSDKSMNAQVLTWNERLRIAINAAQGLDYLHNGCKPPIIHRDLKTANILLNESMQAKIADFGLSKAFASENDSHISTRPAGTPAYLDPEFQSSGNLNRKSDVYSFGIILLELVTGCPAMIRSTNGYRIHILQWVRPIIQRGDIQSIVDPQLEGKFSINSAWKLVEIAMSCVQATAIQRPDISHVLTELKECWDTETASSRNQQGLGGSKRRSTESFDMMPVELSSDFAPIAR